MAHSACLDYDIDIDIASELNYERKNELNHDKTNNVVSEQVLYKMSCTSTEDGYRVQILNLERRGIVLSVWRKQRC